MSGSPSHGCVEPLGWLLALAFLLLLPGFAWTRATIPAARGLDLALFSIGGSVALMALALTLGNYLLGIRITPTNAVWMSALISLAAATGPLSRMAYARLRAAVR